MARTFVVGAHVSRGGGYMAYHVGRIVAGRLGLDPVAVRVGAERPGGGAFDYPRAFDEVGVDDLLDVATADDLLVCNPSYSGHSFGLRFPGRTLMYVQGVSTFRVIDGFFDHYVACSGFVHDHLALHYGWDVPVIVPFVHTERIAEPVPWCDRPPGSVAVVTKTLGEELLDRVRVRLAVAHPDVVVTMTMLRGLPHRSVLRVMGEHRYLLNLTPLEGYGLMPLEAMLSGCCVVGFHGGGGLEYLRPGVNAAVAGFPRVDWVADALADLVRDPSRAAALAAQGRHDVGDQTYDRFDSAWTAFADEHLGATAARPV